jgi:DNA-binding SARP family transcriptional activator
LVPLGGARQRLVLAPVMVNANALVSAYRLIDIVWDADPPERAVTAVQKYVHRLRTAIDPARAAADPAGRP